MKLNLFKKVCLSVMGIGVVGSLMSVGTFATFTATTTNPGNTFAAGTLQLQNSATNNTTISGPNVITFGGFTGSACSTNVEASACQTAILTSKIVTGGFEPKQSASTKLTIINEGTLPATMGLQLQNVTSNKNGAGVAIASTACATDNASVPQSPTGGGCVEFGNGLTLTIQDDFTPPSGSATTQCLYGQGSTAFTTPVLGTGGSYWIAHTAACDTPTLTALPPAADVLGSSSSTNDATHFDFFHIGTKATTGVMTTATGSQSNIIYAPGGSSTKSLTTATDVAQWKSTESHTFTITVGFPDTGVTSVTDANTDTYNVGNEDKYQSGSVGFDLVWLAAQ